LQSEIKLELAEMGEDGYHIFCEAKVNGIDVRALIDTGASKSVVTRAFSRQLVNVIPIAYEDSHSSGVGGEVIQPDFIQVESVKMGKIKLKDVIIGILDLDHVEEVYNAVNVKPFEFLIGADLLVMYRASIDLRRGKMKIRG